MNYEKIYNDLIESRKCRILNETEYYEKHHIIPRCLGGTNLKENIIKLTAKEHFICHKLLFKFHTGIAKMKMGYALHRMCFPNNKNQISRKITSRIFTELKKIYLFICGSNHPRYGKTHTIENRIKFSEQKMGENNPRYGKLPWNYGLTKYDTPSLIVSVETRKKISERGIGRKHTTDTKEAISLALKGVPKSNEHKEKIAKTLSGRKLLKVTRDKISQANKGKKQALLICPYCGKCGGTAMHRWHFENCKFKI